MADKGNNKRKQKAGDFFLWGGGQRKEATFSNLQLPEMPAERAYVLTHGGAWKLREG